MSKTQVWLREDERDLVYRALVFLSEQCAERVPLNGRVDKFSVALARDRLTEVSSHFAPKAPQS